MTKSRKTPAWFRIHADLAETVNAKRLKEGLPLSTVATKRKAEKKSAFVERKPYRARQMPADYVTIEQQRADLQRELGFAEPEPVAPFEPVKLPYHLRD